MLDLDLLFLLVYGVNIDIAEQSSFSNVCKIYLALAESKTSELVHIDILIICRRQIGDIYLFNPLQDDKILDWSKSKQIADDILKCT